MKKCRICLEKFPISEFAYASTGGRRKECKKCKKKESEKYNKKKTKALKEWRSFYE